VRPAEVLNSVIVAFFSDLKHEDATAIYHLKLYTLCVRRHHLDAYYLVIFLKGKILPTTSHKDPDGVCICTLSLTSSLDG
jgi:hypothetical protein